MGLIGIDMTESVAQIQAELQVSASDPDPNVVGVYNAVPNIWTSFADKAGLYPRLQYYYAKRVAAEALIGAMRANIDAADLEGNVRVNQLLTNAVAIRDQAQAEIADLEAKYSASVASVTGRIRKKQERRPRSGCVDPSSPLYRGDPLPRPKKDWP